MGERRLLELVWGRDTESDGVVWIAETVAPILSLPKLSLTVALLIIFVANCK